MNINCVTIRNANLIFQINVFVEEFIDMQMGFSLIFFSRYKQLFFDKRSPNFIAFITFFELLRIIIFSQKVINFVEQFARIVNHLLIVHISNEW